MHWHLAFVQLFFTLGWTVYVIFLPGLMKQAGLDLSWLPWILIVDQLLFAVADLVTGVWLDRSEKLLRAAGNWLTLLVLVACAIFVLMPLLAQSSLTWLFLPALLLWVLCSSVLRVPPLVLLAKYAAPAQPGTLTFPVASYLFGLGLAGAVAPYLTVLLKNRDPMLPFVLASLALAVAMLALRRQPIKPACHATPVAPTVTPSGFAVELPTLLAVGLFAFGMQLHAAVNSAKLFTRVAPAVPLELLMPLFWAGFSVAMFPAALWLARDVPGTDSTRARAALQVAGLVGGLAFVACVITPSLPLLIALQIIAGAVWASVFLAAIALAAARGRTGREGAWIGVTLALIALATMGRILLVTALSPDAAGASGSTIAAQLPWSAGGSWLVAAGLLGLAFVRRKGA